MSRRSKLYSTRRLVEAGRERGHEVKLVDTLRCYMNMATAKPTINYRGEPLDNFDAVIPRIGASITFYGTAVVRQFEMMGVYAVNESSPSRSRDKLRSMQLLAQRDIGLPVTGFAHTTDDIPDLIDMVGGAPLVVKLLEGTQGVGVVLCETLKAAESVIEAFFGIDVNIMVQEYIAEAGGADIRPGGSNLIEYNTRDGDRSTRVEEFTPYRSDAVWNYEAGLRSTWQDGRLLLNGSVYRINWADMQSPTFRAYAATQGRYQQSGRSLVNIGESEVIGIEAMAIYAVNDNLELTGHLGWKDSEILEDQRPNYVGLPLPGSTTGIQYSVLADWAQDTALGELRANVTFRSVRKRWGHFTKDHPNDPYTMTDASASLRRGALELSLFLDNVFDDRAIVWQTPNYPGWPRGASNWRDQFVGYYSVLRPRTLALSVGVNF